MADPPRSEAKIFHVDFYQAIGEFVMMYSGVEHFLTVLLTNAFRMPVAEGYLLLQGLSFQVKSRKLRMMLRHKIDGAQSLADFFDDFDQVTKFRDKLMHWNKFSQPDMGVLDLKDFGRNPQDVLATQMSLTLDQLTKLNAWLSDVHAVLFTITLPVIRGDTFQKAVEDSALPLGAPPLPSASRAKPHTPD